MRFGRGKMEFILIAAFLGGGAGTSYRESTGEYIDDRVISTKVKTTLLRWPMVNGLDAQVETFKHRVQLRGYVNDVQRAEQAARFAREIAGVKAVENHLSIK